MRWRGSGAAVHASGAMASLRQAWEIFRQLGAIEATQVAAELRVLNEPVG